MTHPLPLARPRTRRVWTALSLPPVLFLLVIIAASVYFGVAAGSGADSAAIAAQVTAATPYLLLVVQALLLVLALAAIRADRLTARDLGWEVAPGQRAWRESLLGAGLGLGLAALYVVWLSPWMTTLQRNLGDYVPAGELLPTLGGALVPFFAANVALAPFVEESLYRGYALSRLRARFGQPAAIVITCVFFGLLHWTGGLWYMLLTGLVAGGLLAGLFVWRRSLVAPFAAHLALNTAEFFYIWLVAAR